MTSPDQLSALDEPCRELVAAMNRLPGIQTTESCCGHGERPMGIFFQPRSLADLPELLYWFSACHSGVSGSVGDGHNRLRHVAGLLLRRVHFSGRRGVSRS